MVKGWAKALPGDLTYLPKTLSLGPLHLLYPLKSCFLEESAIKDMNIGPKCTNHLGFGKQHEA